MICISHTDFDGIASAAIVKEKYPECKFIFHNHGDKINLDKINDDLIMCDMSFPIDDMLKLANRCPSFIYIDHHISAINEYNKRKDEFPDTFECSLVDGTAACELSWKYFFDDDVPYFIMLLSKYDTKVDDDINEWDNTIMPFQYGLKSICNSFETFPFALFDDTNLVDYIIKKGETILKFVKLENEDLCKKYCFEASIKGYKAICLNTGVKGSVVVDSVINSGNYDLAFIFCFDGEKYNCSFYTNKTNVDCSQIASEFGGGGHAQASGCVVDSLEGILEI